MNSNRKSGGTRQFASFVCSDDDEDDATPPATNQPLTAEQRGYATAPQLLEDEVFQGIPMKPEVVDEPSPAAAPFTAQTLPDPLPKAKTPPLPVQAVQMVVAEEETIHEPAQVVMVQQMGEETEEQINAWLEEGDEAVCCNALNKRLETSRNNALLKRVLVQYRSKDGGTYLHIAAKNGCDNVITFLLTANPLAPGGESTLKQMMNHSNANKETALALARRFHHESTVKKLLAAGAVDPVAVAKPLPISVVTREKEAEPVASNINKAITADGETRLHIATKLRYLESVQELLKQPDITSSLIEKRNHLQETALSIAIRNDDDLIVRALLAAGARDYTRANVSMLGFAAEVKATKTVNFLLTDPITQGMYSVDERKNKGKSAIEITEEVNDPTFRAKNLRLMYELSYEKAALLVNALDTNDKETARHLLNSGVPLARVSKENAARWQYMLSEEKREMELRAWEQEIQADHPDMIILREKMAMLRAFKHPDEVAKNLLITEMERFLKQLNDSIDRFKPKKGAKPYDHAHLNKIRPIVLAKHAATFLHKLTTLEDAAAFKENFADRQKNAIKEFRRNFKRVLGWKAFVKALGLISLAAGVFIASYFITLAVLSLFVMTLPLAVKVTIAATPPVIILCSGVGMFVRRDKFTRGGLAVAKAADELVENVKVPGLSGG